MEDLRPGCPSQPRGPFFSWAGGRAVPGTADRSPHDSFPWAGRLVSWGICLRPELGERGTTHLLGLQSASLRFFSFVAPFSLVRQGVEFLSCPTHTRRGLCPELGCRLANSEPPKATRSCQ